MADKMNMVNRGNVVVYNDDLWLVTSLEHVKPGKGPAYLQVKLRNLKKGGVVAKRFNPTDEVEIAFIDTVTMEYLYEDATGFVFMDTKTYDQHTISRDMIGEDMRWVRPNQKVSVKLYQGQPIIIDLPPTVVLQVVQCDAAARGDTVRSVNKAAKLETGTEIRVPAFVEEGEWIKVDTRSGEFSSRASKNEIPE